MVDFKRNLFFPLIIKTKFNRKNKLRTLYGYWTHCLYSCDPNTYESWTKQGKMLPTVKLDQYFNPINVNNNDSELDENKSNKISIRMNNSETTEDNETKMSTNGSNGDLNNSEFLKSSHSDKDQRLVEDTEQKLKIKNSETQEFQEVWRAVPRPIYGADVRDTCCFFLSYSL